MELDRDLLEEAVGASLLMWQPADTGGYTRSRAWRVETRDGPVFAKEARDEGSLAMLRREGVVHRGVGGPFLPGFVGFADDGTRATLAIELMEDVHWPPPYPDDVTPLFAALDLVASSPPELPAHGPHRWQWEQVAAEPGPFLVLGMCSAAWLDGALDALLAAEAEAEFEGSELVHNDVYSGNVAFTSGDAVLVDWGAAVRGSRSIDVALTLLSVRVEGGTPPALDFPAEPAFAAAFAGHFAVEAPAPLPDWAEPGSTLREDMRGDLVHALRWAAELLELPPPRLSERVFYPVRVRAEYRLEPCKTALNPVRGMPFKWSLNPYMGCVHRCTFCYVRDFERRAERPSDERYGTSIRVKTNVAEVLRRELARPSWEGESVALGTATDPYQPAEGRFRLTRACLQALCEADNDFSIVTRGPLIVRDVDVLQEASARAEVAVYFSIPTLDERVWRTTEPGTAQPRSRLEAVRRLSGAGIDVGVGMAPLLPGLSDRPEQLEEVVREARAAGASAIWANVVRLRPAEREHFLSALAEDWPEEVERYEALFATRASLPAELTKPILDHVRSLTRETPTPTRSRRPERQRRRHAEQLTLAV